MTEVLKKLTEVAPLQGQGHDVLYRPLRNRLGARVYARDCGIVWGNNAITLFFYKNLAFYENEQRLRNAQKLRTCTCLEHPEAENVY